MKKHPLAVFGCSGTSMHDVLVLRRVCRWFRDVLFQHPWISRANVLVRDDNFLSGGFASVTRFRVRKNDDSNNYSLVLYLLDKNKDYRCSSRFAFQMNAKHTIVVRSHWQTSGDLLILIVDKNDAQAKQFETFISCACYPYIQTEVQQITNDGGTFVPLIPVERWCSSTLLKKKIISTSRFRSYDLEVMSLTHSRYAIVLVVVLGTVASARR